MNKIANISKEKHPQIDPFWQIGEREIIISSYCLRRGRSHNIRQISNEGCNIIAIDHTLRQQSRLHSPLFVSEGKLLTIALLPSILDKQKSGWREENIAVNCNGLAGFLATLRLLTETRHLSITGYHATAIKELLFHKYGMITETAPASFSLHELALPKVVNTSKGDIPIEIAEALLIIATGAYPRKDIRYLRQLSKTAATHSFLVN